MIQLNIYIILTSSLLAKCWIKQTMVNGSFWPTSNIYINIVYTCFITNSQNISFIQRYIIYDPVSSQYTRLYLTDIRAQQPGSVDVVAVDEEAAIGPGLTAHARTWVSSCG